MNAMRFMEHPIQQTIISAKQSFLLFVWLNFCADSDLHNPHHRCHKMRCQMAPVSLSFFLYIVHSIGASQPISSYDVYASHIAPHILLLVIYL